MLVYIVQDYIKNSFHMTLELQLTANETRLNLDIALQYFLDLQSSCNMTLIKYSFGLCWNNVVIKEVDHFKKSFFGLCQLSLVCK